QCLDDLSGQGLIRINGVLKLSLPYETLSLQECNPQPIFVPASCQPGEVREPQYVIWRWLISSVAGQLKLGTTEPNGAILGAKSLVKTTICKIKASYCYTPGCVRIGERVPLDLVKRRRGFDIAPMPHRFYGVRHCVQEGWLSASFPSLCRSRDCFEKIFEC